MPQEYATSRRPPKQPNQPLEPIQAEQLKLAHRAAVFIHLVWRFHAISSSHRGKWMWLDMAWAFPGVFHTPFVPPKSLLYMRQTEITLSGVPQARQRRIPRLHRGCHLSGDETLLCRGTLRGKKVEGSWAPHFARYLNDYGSHIGTAN